MSEEKPFRFFFETCPAGDEPIVLDFFENDLQVSEEEFIERHAAINMAAQVADLRARIKPHKCPCHDEPISLNVGVSEGRLFFEINWCDEHWDRHVAERRKRDGAVPTSGPCVRASDLMAD
jgi:hypothetical protein